MKRRTREQRATYQRNKTKELQVQQQLGRAWEEAKGEGAEDNRDAQGDRGGEAPRELFEEFRWGDAEYR